MVKRRYLTDKQKAEVIARQGGVCAELGCNDTGPFVFDHVNPLWVSENNDVSNFQGICTEHNRIKTAKDARDRAKIKRILVKANRVEREKRKRKRIFSKGFDRRWRKKLDGTTQERLNAARMA